MHYKWVSAVSSLWCTLLSHICGVIFIMGLISTVYIIEWVSYMWCTLLNESHLCHLLNGSLQSQIERIIERKIE
jgi:hypothetical protein